MLAKHLCGDSMRCLPLAVLVLLLSASSPSHSQDIPCSSTVPLARQHRTSVKHRPPAPGAEVHQVKIAAVLQWAPPAGVTTPKQRKLDQPFAPRENEVYTVEGDVWRIKLEDNDCDFHLELSVPGKLKTSPRIIVEIPQGAAFLEARDKVLETLAANGYDPAVGKAIDLDAPIRVRVTGYAFYDSAHFSKKNPKKGHGHGTKYVGTLWEIHPAWKIEFSDE